MRLFPSVFGVVVIVLFSSVESAPGGFLDFLNFGPPRKVRTVYVVKPSHEHGNGHSSSGPPPKTIIKYVSKPPKSPSSPFSLISSMFSSGGGLKGWGSSSSFSGGSSGWGSSSSSSGKRGKTTTMAVDEETFSKLTGENQLENQNAQNFGSEDSDSQVEHVSRPQSPSNLGGMRPPSSSGNLGQGYESSKSQPLRSRPSQKRPSSSVVVRTSSNSESRRPIKPNSSRSKGSSSSGSSSGWSSGPPTTITYVTKGWGSSSGGWGGWSPPSSGWGSSNEDEDDEWSSFGDGGDSEWQPGSPPPSSSSSGWSQPDNSSPDTDAEQPSGTGEQEQTPEAPEGGISGPAAGAEGPAEIGPVDNVDAVGPAENVDEAGPADTVDEVGPTEEGENRRPTNSRRPVQRPGNRRPQTGGRNAQLNFGPIKMRPPPRQNLPRTNEPQPEYVVTSGRQQSQSVSSGGGYEIQSPQSSRALYSEPVQNSQSSTSNSGDIRLGDEVIKNQNGLLDAELIQTVQQIIQTYKI